MQLWSAFAIAVSPICGALSGCDVTLSANASIGQSCLVAEDCPSGQRCLPAAKGSTCQVAEDGEPLATDAAAEGGDGGDGGGDATIADSAASRPDPGAGASDGDGAVADARAQGDVQPADADVEDSRELDRPESDVPDSGFVCNPSFPPSTLVLFGGEGLNGTLGDTWLWDGTAWSEADAGSGAPPPRQAAAMATACGYAVLVGGTGSIPSDGGSPLRGDAWLWDGSRWRAAPSAPPARFEGAAATLGFTLYLFGGQGDPMHPAEPGLLAWDGAWSTPPQSNVPGPGARSFPVFVSVGAGLLVFGGQDTSGNVVGDTWLLTSTSWQLLDDGGTDSGPALQAAGAASVGGSVVMFGGLDESFDTLGDTWVWDGGAWSEIPAQADGGPPPRAYPAMGTLDGRVVLFGGLDTNGLPLGDTWLWDGGTWAPGPDAGPPARTGAAMTAY